MTLGSLLSVDQIIPEMKATERWAAIVELIDLLVQKNRVRTSDRDSILAALAPARGDDEHRNRIRDRDSSRLFELRE